MNSNGCNSKKRCLRCGKPLEIRHGKYGKYLDCIGYPKCNYTKKY